MSVVYIFVYTNWSGRGARAGDRNAAKAALRKSPAAVLAEPNDLPAGRLPPLLPGPVPLPGGVPEAVTRVIASPVAITAEAAATASSRSVAPLPSSPWRGGDRHGHLV